VLVTSVGTDAPFSPLNLLWGVLFWKKRAEEALQRSGLEYTIIRPGELRQSRSRWPDERGKSGKTAGGIMWWSPTSSMHSEITQILLRTFSYANTSTYMCGRLDDRGEDGQDQLAGHDTFGTLPAPANLSTNILKLLLCRRPDERGEDGITTRLDASVTFWHRLSPTQVA